MAIIICLTGLFYVVNFPRRQMVVFAFLIFITIALAAVLIKRGRNAESVAVFALLFISLLIKSDYVIYTPSYVRQHDVIGFGAGFGQAAFIEYFYEKIRLIDFDPREYWGFFQPPLHHMIAGMWLRLMDFICPNYGWACDNVQLLTLLYSALIPFVSVKIFKQIGLHNISLIVATAFVALHPCFILLAGSINNDVLCLLFQVLAIYFFILWNEEFERIFIGEGKNRDCSMVYIILSALCMGLTMMAKLSGFLIAPAIGVVMLMRLVELCKLSNVKLCKPNNSKMSSNELCKLDNNINDSVGENKKKHVKLCKLIAQYAVFGIISVPLGMWSPVRNLVKFGVPLNFTPEVGEPLTGHSVLSRIFDIRTSTPFTNLIGNGSKYDEYNFFLGMLKTSLVGEYTFADIRFATLFGWMLLISGAILTVLIIICAIIVIKKKLLKSYLNIFLLVYTITTLVFYVNLCFSIPNFSSLDFRYIAHLIVVGAVYLGIYVNYFCTNNSITRKENVHIELADKENAHSGVADKINASNSTAAKYINICLLITLCIFSISSIALYLLVGSISWR